MAKVKKKLNIKARSKNHKDVQTSVEVVKNLGKGDTNTVSKKEHSPKVENRNTPTNMLREGQCIVGLSKGITVNLGGYQSARIDCSLTRVARDDDRSIMDELIHISGILDEQLEYETDQLEDLKV